MPILQDTYKELTSDMGVIDTLAYIGGYVEVGGTILLGLLNGNFSALAVGDPVIKIGGWALGMLIILLFSMIRLGVILHIANFLRGGK